MYVKRDIEKVLKEYAKFPVVAILGPRQSGKTTLATTFFKNHTYVSFEDPELRACGEKRAPSKRSKISSSPLITA